MDSVTHILVELPKDNFHANREEEECIARYDMVEETALLKSASLALCVKMIARVPGYRKR